MNHADAAFRAASWRCVRDELLRRINERIWRPGDLIPNEAALADEFQCARATVSRAVRDLADKGLVTRRRRAGTRVALNPPARAVFQIPILREEVEAKGVAHRHIVLERALAAPPALVRHRLAIAHGAAALHVATLHLAGGAPYAFDDRWIHLEAAPEVLDADFDRLSPNEWLVQNTPYTDGEIALSAEDAPERVATRLNIAPKSATLVLERATWRGDTGVTMTRISFPPGHRIFTSTGFRR